MTVIYPENPEPGGRRIKPTLTEFLLERIAEDEAAARAAGNVQAWRDDLGRSWLERPSGERVELPHLPSGMEADWLNHAVRHLPGRVLAGCEAKRRIVERSRWTETHPEWASDMEMGGHWEDADAALRDLGLSYGDHPDYREEWAP